MVVCDGWLEYSESREHSTNHIKVSPISISSINGVPLDNILFSNTRVGRREGSLHGGGTYDEEEASC